MPTYSPDYNPIEKLWKKIKQQETHLHYFPTFEALTEKVEQALLKFANIPEEEILGTLQPAGRISRGCLSLLLRTIFLLEYYSAKTLGETAWKSEAQAATGGRRGRFLGSGPGRPVPAESSVQ